MMDHPSFMLWAFHYTGKSHWKKARNVEFHTNTVKRRNCLRSGWNSYWTSSIWWMTELICFFMASWWSGREMMVIVPKPPWQGILKAVCAHRVIWMGQTDGFLGNSLMPKRMYGILRPRSKDWEYLRGNFPRFTRVPCASVYSLARMLSHLHSVLQSDDLHAGHPDSYLPLYHFLHIFELYDCYDMLIQGVC